MQTLYYKTISGKSVGIKKITTVFSEGGLCRVIFGGSEELAQDSFLKKYYGPFQLLPLKYDPLQQVLNDYLQHNKPLNTKTVFDFRGTPFQKKCWQALVKIPQGKTLSYRKVAEIIGSPQAFRAVGGACGANPIPLLVPCHRVLASDGSLGGFSGGLSIKKNLLRHEQVL